MTKEIWKYQLQRTDTQVLLMPADAEILTLQVQHGEPCIWVMVSPDAPKRKVTIETYGTGHPIPTDVRRKYLGTYQLLIGSLIFHCFERLG